MYRVEGMTCGHCVATVGKAARQAAPGVEVAVDAASGLMTVRGAHDKDRLIAAVAAAGYTAREI